MPEQVHGAVGKPLAHSPTGGSLCYHCHRLRKQKHQPPQAPEIQAFPLFFPVSLLFRFPKQKHFELKIYEHLFCDFIDDTIKTDEMLDKIIEMKKRIQQIKQIKEMHPYEIHSTEKSGWFTNVDDPTQPNGKRKIRRANEESFWDAMIDWYISSTDKNISFKLLFDKWINWKTTPSNAATIKRIMASWKAYYLEEPLSKKLLETPVSRITSLMLREWAESLMKII